MPISIGGLARFGGQSLAAIQEGRTNALMHQMALADYQRRQNLENERLGLERQRTQADLTRAQAEAARAAADAGEEPKIAAYLQTQPDAADLAKSGLRPSTILRLYTERQAAGRANRTEGRQSQTIQEARRERALQGDAEFLANQPEKPSESVIVDSLGLRPEYRGIDKGILRGAAARAVAARDRSNQWGIQIPTGPPPSNP